jgi:hypothetical protein
MMGKPAFPSHYEYIKMKKYRSLMGGNAVTGDFNTARGDY